MCKHRKKVRSSQACISINSCTELSKTKVFPVSLSQCKYSFEYKNFLGVRSPFWGAQNLQLRWRLLLICAQLVLMIYIVDIIKWHVTNLFSGESNIWYIWYPSVTTSVQHFTKLSWTLQSFSFCSKKHLHVMVFIY